MYKYRGGFRRGRRGRAPPPPPPPNSLFFAITYFFGNHFEELQTELFEVELIINNASLTYVYPNTIKACLTPSHLLIGRQLLYSSNTTSTIVKNLTVLSSTTDKLNRMSNQFLDRWRHEYVVNLRETQGTSKLNENSLKIEVNDIVLVYDGKVPRQLWRTAIVTRVLPSSDSEIREAIVRTAKINTILKGSVNKHFVVGNTYHGTSQTDRASHKEIASPFPCCPVNRGYS